MKSSECSDSFEFPTNFELGDYPGGTEGGLPIMVLVPALTRVVLEMAWDVAREMVQLMNCRFFTRCSAVWNNAPSGST